MKQTRDEFKDQLYDIWATYFECSPLMLRNGGLSVIPRDNLKDTGLVHLYKIDKRSIAYCDIEVRSVMVDMMQINGLRKGVGYGMTEAEIQSELADKALEHDHVLWLFYLYPPDFKPYTSSDFNVRQLSESDEGALDDLHSACTPADVDEAEVSVTDELAYGAFEGDKMVACASLYDWRGFGDPGVLVHPDYRKRGLGKAVVSPICQWVLDQGRVMNYRCDSRNTGSARIAKRLGFTQYFEIEVFKLVV